VSLVVLVIGLGAVLAGCTSPGTGAATELTVDAVTGSATGSLEPSQATLTCARTPHATGYLHDVAESACRFVAGGGVAGVAEAQHGDRLCAQVYGGPQRARISGRIDTRGVRLTVTRSDACGTADWNALAPLLGDPEREGGASARIAPTDIATTTTTGPIAYQVKRGDTLTSIARQFGVSISAIQSLNGLPDPDHLVEGQNLLIPRIPPVRIIVSPSQGALGASFSFELVGAKPSEQVTFEVDSPDGKHTGPPHAAADDGSVVATYQTSSTGSSGSYRVVARGDQGTTVEATFAVTPAAATTTVR
jgi:LysM repeat protein